RPGFSFQLPNGKYPLQIDYNDYLPLDSLKTAEGAPFPVAPGMELEYWLEARDNCDYPDPAGNLGSSKRYKLIVGPPKNGDQAQQDRAAAQKQQAAHQQKQDQSLADQKAQAQAEAGQGNDAKGTSDLASDANR